MANILDIQEINILKFQAPAYAICEVLGGSVVLGTLGHPLQSKRPCTSCHQERSSRLGKLLCVLEAEYFTVGDTALTDSLNDVERTIY